MKKNLGSGKIAFPRLENVVVRERLFTLLDNSQEKLITWVSGPPGAGKTTLVSSYLAERKKPYLWVRCDKTDNDIGSFISYLSFSAEQAQRGLGKSLPTFTPEYAGDVEPFIRNYLRTLLETLKRETIIVLDDFHEVQHKGALKQYLAAMADEFNTTHTFIVISRKPVLETLARIQLNQQLLHIDWQQLQLTEAETQDYIELQGGVQDKTRVKLLHKLCKGWIAALKMIVLSKQNIVPEEPPTEDNLDQTLFFNYLAQETFNHLSHEQKQALMRLALSPSMTSQHLALAANDDCNIAQIEQLLNQQLVQKYSKPVAHYKFHPLYKEFLQQQAEDHVSEANRTQIRLTSADILFQQGLTFEAAELYMQLNHYEKLAEIVLEHGDAMCKQGRYEELETWLKHLPEHNFEQQPWLQYWQASSILTTDQERSQKLFERAFDQFFQDKKDVKGIYLSWLGALEACMFSFKNYGFVAEWLKELDSVRKIYPKFPSMEIRMRILGGYLMTTIIGHPTSEFTKSALDTCTRLARFVPLPILRLTIGTQLTWCFYSMGDGVRFRKMNDWMLPHINNSNIAPFLRLNAGVSMAIHDWTTFSKDSRKSIYQALELANETGIHHFDANYKAHLMQSFLVEGDLNGAREIQQKLFGNKAPEGALDNAAYACVCAVLEAMSGNINLARKYILESIEDFSAIGFRIPAAESKCLYAEILAETQEYEEAMQCIKQALSLADQCGSQLLVFHVYISMSVVALHKKDKPLLLDSLSKAFSLGESNQLYATNAIRRDNVLKLCIAAYEKNIEIKYAQKLVNLYKFTYPSNYPLVEQWPWKLKVEIFDNFDVQIEGENIAVKSKSQTKALELLQIISAMGGENIENWYVAEMLWPDSEGDAAHHAFETTLHRLRKQVGKEMVLVQNNKISLSREHCWTDVWQFEALISQIKEVISLKGESSEVEAYMKNLNAIYSGNVLSSCDSSWVISLREKYKEKYTRIVAEVVNYFQNSAVHESALGLLEYALEIETSSEDLYLQTMLCYEALGERSKAMDVYRKCENNLMHKHNAQLSSQIKQLAISLQ